MVLEGYGSHGIVLSSPRIPLEDENYEDVIRLNQVSKILYYEHKYSFYPSFQDDFEREYIPINELSIKYSFIFNKEYFILTIGGGIIDKKLLIEKFKENNLYGYNWLSKSSYIYHIINNILHGKKKIYQLIYEKADKINLDFDNFLIKINNILNILNLSNSNGFFFDDIKLENIVIHENKIKIIDISEPLNTNNSIEYIINKIEESKFYYIFYYPYNTISNILLYDYIGKINLIGKKDKKKNNENNNDYNENNDYNNDYHSLLYLKYYEFKSNIDYKINLLEKLVKLTNIYLPKFKIRLSLLNYCNIDNIKSYEELETLFEYKEITINILSDSLKKIYLIESKVDIIQNKKMINIIINGYKKIIDKYIINLKDKINFLLENINIYSYGFIFLEWLSKNADIITKSKNFERNFSIYLNTILLCCSNIIIINDDIFFSFTKYTNLK